MAKKKTLRREPRVQTAADLPVWLAAKLTTQRQAWASGLTRNCVHDPQPGRALAHMCSWKPEIVACPRCTHLFNIAAHDPDAHRCDCCDRDVADTIGGKMTISGVTYWFAVCEACQRGKMTRA